MPAKSPASDINKKDHLCLVDGSGYIFRAYHALPPLTRKSDGLPVGAVSGFCNMMHRLIGEMKIPTETPITHIAIIFDASGKSFRNDLYPEYKAHRPPAPEDLVPQFSLVRDATRAFSLPAVELEGFEADDLIATYATHAEQAGAQVTIISSDKDLMQLVTKRVTMLDTMKDKHIGIEQVEEKFGVLPERVVDVQALAGDSSDNVPGVPGIGIKTAAQLIQDFGDLDTLLAQADSIRQHKRRENLIAFADQARLSRDLVRLERAAPVPLPINEMKRRPPDPETLIGFLKDMEFQTLTKRIASGLEVDADAIAPAGRHAPQEAAASDSSAPATPSASSKNAVTAPVNTGAYETVTDLKALQVWADNIIHAGQVAVDVETDTLDALRARLVGISLCTTPGHACYIPLLHGVTGELSLDGDTPQQIKTEDALHILKPVLENPAILKIGQNIKYDMLVFRQHDVHVAPIDDTMLMSYALDAGRNSHGMDELSSRHLDHKPIPFKDVVGSGKTQTTFDTVPLDKATAYAAEDADVTLRLALTLKPRLVSESMMTVYETLERPLVPVLTEMEAAGVRVDAARLALLSGEFTTKMEAMEKTIHKLAGERFNIGSPKQLGEILFDKMNLPGGTKTRTGAWATGADVLDDLAARGHELPEHVLEWRQLSKLKSTYTDALPEFVNPDTGRVHTSYAMASTSTGRLSSSDPNLQNIPIRTEDGRRIRTAFIAEDGCRLISADYSQIELRILSEMAGVDTLKQAFHEGLDIHAMTASEIFGVPLKEMDSATRRRAKAINFGIIYGISAFGLARQLKIARGEAGDYITAYFKRFPGIRDYMENTKETCRKTEFVSTLFGRKIHIPAINEKNNAARRGFMERAAINAPIQGTAADIIRRAMVRMPRALEEAGLSARMLLQVHDELIFEAPDDEVEAAQNVAVEVMSRAPHPAVELSVPLVVDARAASNWDEAH
ncbi:MAG: DNA polymerase I [Parvularculales bacterium]